MRQKVFVVFCKSSALAVFFPLNVHNVHETLGTLGNAKCYKSLESTLKGAGTNIYLPNFE